MTSLFLYIDPGRRLLSGPGDHRRHPGRRLLDKEVLAEIKVIFYPGLRPDLQQEKKGTMTDPSAHHIPAPQIPHPASFRDPAGFVFTMDGVVYRQVNKWYSFRYDYLHLCGLYDRLTGQGLRSLIQKPRRTSRNRPTPTGSFYPGKFARSAIPRSGVPNN